MNRFWRWIQSHVKSKPARAKLRRARRLQLESLDARRVLASVHQNPGQVFDVNNDTYVDQEDIRLSDLRLSTQGEGQLPATRDHHLIPFYDVNGDGAFTKQDIADLRKQIQQGPVTTSFKLANDSGNKLDRTTNDVRIVGRVMNFDPQTRVIAWFGGGRWSQVDVTDLISRDGSFHFSIHDLHRINGRLLNDGDQTMFMKSYIRPGRTSGVVDYAFTIDRTGPAAFNLDARVFDAPIARNPSTWVVRWNHLDARSYDLKITYDAAGENVMLDKKGLTEADANRYVVGSLSRGTYYVWLTGFDASGNQTFATGNGQRVDWVPTFNPATVPTMNPAQITTTTSNDGVKTTIWKAIWTNHGNDVQSSKIVVTRDRAGTDVALEFTPYDRFTSVSLTHLPKGTYYVFITENRLSGSVKICDGVEVSWNPTRPDDFSVEPPGFGIGDSIDLNWQAANTAVRYKVELFRTDLFSKMHLNVFIPPGGDSYDRWPSFIPAGSYDSTTNNLLVSGLEEGLYAVQVTAYDAAGNRTIAKELRYFTIDADGVIPKGSIQAYLQGSDKAYFSAYPTSSSTLNSDDTPYYKTIGGVNGITTTRFKFYSDPSLKASSLVGTHFSKETNLTLPLASLLSYPKLYLKVTYYDNHGTRLDVTSILTVEPSKLEPMFSFTPIESPSVGIKSK